MSIRIDWTDYLYTYKIYSDKSYSTGQEINIEKLYRAIKERLIEEIHSGDKDLREAIRRG